MDTLAQWRTDGTVVSRRGEMDPYRAGKDLASNSRGTGGTLVSSPRTYEGGTAGRTGRRMRELDYPLPLVKTSRWKDGRTSNTWTRAGTVDDG